MVQVDGKLPNLALMQICSFHESLGHDVEWFKGMLFAHEYDQVYASQIFSFSKMPPLPSTALVGGTGITVDKGRNLPEEISVHPPSYSLYPDCTFHLGFTMKGCRLNCSFCVVPKKEGRPWVNSTIDGLLLNPNGADRLMLLDNDFFGGAAWRENLERIVTLNLKVCFVQGLNIRLLKPEQAELLSNCQYRNSTFAAKYLTFAWDIPKQEKLIFDGIDLCERSGIPASRLQFFVLIGYDSTPEQDLSRVTKLFERGCDPYAMPYNKFDPYQKAFCRWVNRRMMSKVPWEDYSYGDWQRSKRHSYIAPDTQQGILAL